ncbi:MAG: hypothetical protein ACTHPS_18865 [Streptosporangiaceae bacterium]
MTLELHAKPRRAACLAALQQLLAKRYPFATPVSSLGKLGLWTVQDPAVLAVVR